MGIQITGFLQNRNGVTDGHLERCLSSFRHTVDEMVVYDDASTEAVRPLYERYECRVIYGQEQAFRRELYHKQQLLAVAQRLKPNWVCWFDSDACLGRFWEDRQRTEDALTKAAEAGCLLLHLHNINLWRSPRWYRTDQKFNDLWHGVFWRNTGEWHYQPRTGLHQKQFPLFFRDPGKQRAFWEDQVVRRPFRSQAPDSCLLHYGFASDADIARKYFTYRDHGQTGWPLDRLVDESSLELEEAPAEWFPKWLGEVADEARPQPVFSPEQMAGYADMAAWENGQ